MPAGCRIGSLRAARRLVFDQVTDDLRTDLHFQGTVVHIAKDAGVRFDIHQTGGVDRALDLAVDDHMGDAHIAFDAAGVAHRQRT